MNRLTLEEDPLADALADGLPRLSIIDINLPEPGITRYLAGHKVHLFPMLLRGHRIGALLVAHSDEMAAGLFFSLQSVASQTAVAVGTTMLCIDRARRLAVQEERIRIAREIHDTVSQSLFGMNYTLTACVKMLPDSPASVKAELVNVAALADMARQQLRHSIMDIWPSELTTESFTTDLTRFLREYCHADGVELNINVRGAFELLPPRIKRDLYRISQESFNNIVRYAAASCISVCMEVGLHGIALAIKDDGKGFDVRTALAREYDREHFGLRGIHERVVSLGGEVEFLSRPDAGTSLLVNLPIVGIPLHG